MCKTCEKVIHTLCITLYLFHMEWYSIFIPLYTKKNKMRIRNGNHRAIGDVGEESAIAFLEKEGYEVLQHNFCVRGGEIDIIAKDGDVYVFVEVKTRHNALFGTPEESISPRKLRCIQRAISLYFQQKYLSEFDTDFRIDLIAIEVSVVNGVRVEEIRHYKNAFLFDDF